MIESQETIKLALVELSSPKHETPLHQPESLATLSKTQKQLGALKDNLNNIIDAMNQHQSILSTMAKFWGERPLWQKITAGTILVVPALILGLALQWAIVTTLSMLTLVTFITVSLLFDNHYSHIELSTTELKSGIAGLADFLSNTIIALETLSKQLADEISKMQKENETLSNQVKKLDDQLQSFSTQVALLTQTEENLKNNIKDLEINLQKQSDLLKETQSELSLKIVELSEVKTAMGLEIEKSKKVAQTLQGVVETLSSTVIEDKENQTKFQNRLNDFLSNKETSFDQIADRICEAEKKLALVQVELKQSNARYQALLDRHEQEITRLENVSRSIQSKSPVASGLRTFSLYANTEKNEIQSSPLTSQIVVNA